MSKFVDKRHIGRIVITAGWIDLDLERRSAGYNQGALRKIPPGYKMILKGISDDYAYCYHHNNGVIRMPFNLLEPWEKTHS